MARMPRVVALDVPHHVTQRGNARQFILSSAAERQVYVGLLREYTELHRLEVLGYCLMSNHVHLIAIPREREALAASMKQAHGRFAAYWNAAHQSSGHVWQGRYYSCPLDAEHLWRALRYTELNPVRAKLVHTPEEWAWSSAPAHCGGSDAFGLSTALWSRCWDAERWKSYLQAGETEEERITIRRSTHTGRPLGSAEFVARLEQITERTLAPRKAGRRAKQETSDH